MEFNIIIDNEFRIGDEADLFFDGDECTLMAADTTMPDILVFCGFFPSKSQARKAGWKPEMSEGFFDQTIGKKKNRLTIFNPTSAYFAAGWSQNGDGNE